MTTAKIQEGGKCLAWGKMSVRLSLQLTAALTGLPTVGGDVHLTFGAARWLFSLTVRTDPGRKPAAPRGGSKSLIVPKAPVHLMFRLLCELTNTGSPRRWHRQLPPSTGWDAVSRLLGEK